MTYNAYETGVASSRPVELYEFNYGTNYYRYTSAVEPVVKAGNTYLPFPIGRGATNSSSENAQSTVTVTAAGNISVADLFRVQPPSGVVTLTVFARQLDDPDAQFVVIWMGRVLGAVWKQGEVEFSCEPVDVSLNRNGLARKYQKACPLVLYGSRCGVNANSFKVTVPAGNWTLTGAILSVPSLVGYAAGYFAGGYIEYENIVTGIAEVRSIRWSEAGNLEIPLVPRGLENAPEIRIFPGCDHTTGANGCLKFSNMLNYGGQPYIPDKTPFGGTQLFL